MVAKENNMNETRSFRTRLERHGGWMGLLFLSSALLAGCAAETADAEPTTTVEALPKLPEEIAASRRARGMGIGTPLTDKERTQVLETLQTRGYRTSDAIFFAENAVLVEGDLLFDGPSVLKNSLSIAKKGYWFGSASFPGFVNYDEIINVASSDGFPDYNWEVAFSDSAEYFAAWTNLHLQGGYDPQYRTIWVEPFGYPANYQGLIAISEAGHDQTDPGHIFINTNFNGLSGAAGPCHVGSTGALPYAVKFHVATHEMMHSMGFAHVGDGQWISGTGVAGTNYSSTMYAGSCLNEQSYYSEGLSSDDVDSINAMYWLEGKQ